MDIYSKEFLKKTINVWQPYSKSKLSLEDAKEIAETMCALYSYLIELEIENKKENEAKKMLTNASKLKNIRQAI